MPLAKILVNGAWRLLRVGGKLAKGCCCGDGANPCLPGENPLVCAPFGKTDMGDDAQAWPLGAERGLISINFTLLAGEAQLTAFMGNAATNTRRLVGPAVETIVVCKPLTVLETSIGVDTFGTNATWEYSAACMGQCCGDPPANPQVNPLP